MTGKLINQALGWCAKKIILQPGQGLFSSSPFRIAPTPSVMRRLLAQLATRLEFKPVQISGYFTVKPVFWETTRVDMFNVFVKWVNISQKNVV